ncbi:MAG: glucose-1-phosphate adenylyltransferase subunit GlgD [Ruminococcaceae bacterium]|nr:glucose-1-phosphate adenylyltransferase subunit GlgD [Oscillospiraceae bacterium]
MIGNDTVGIIFSNMHDNCLRELTDVRTMGSVPYGSRYRAIDFPLSNLVNSGVTKVGIITKSNYQSLMDHLGTGKAWDLSRKHEGLFILPPFGLGNSVYQTRVEALWGILNFLKQCKEQYVIMSDSHIIYTMDFRAVLNEHISKGADMTVVYKNGVMPEDLPEKVRIELGRGRKITEVINGEEVEGKCNWSMGVYVANKDFLIRVISNVVARNRLSFVRDVLQSGISEYRIYGYKFDGFAGVLGSRKGYFRQSMALMDPAVRADLFRSDRPVYTKERDEMPTRFGLGSHVSNSLIADGCIIEGEVENCILFRGVHVGRGAKLKNCIIMQDSIVGDRVQMSYIIGDKDVMYSPDSSMNGQESHPLYIAKGSSV